MLPGGRGGFPPLVSHFQPLADEGQGKHRPPLWHEKEAEVPSLWKGCVRQKLKQPASNLEYGTLSLSFQKPWSKRFC